MSSVGTGAARPARFWRLALLGVVLLTVLLLAALFGGALDHPLVADTGKPGALIFAAIVLALAGAGWASIRRDLRAPLGLLLWSSSASFVVVASLFGVLALFGGDDGAGGSAFGLHAMALETLHGYWPSLATALALIFLSGFLPPLRHLVDSLFPIPFFAWGIDATCGQWMVLSAHWEHPSAWLHFLWLTLWAAVIALLTLIGIVAIWRRRVGVRAWPPIGTVAGVGSALVAVFSDWAFILYVSMPVESAGGGAV